MPAQNYVTIPILFLGMDRYSMLRPKAGVCFIINNLDAKIKATRMDVNNIKEAFETAGFQVEAPKINLSDAEMALFIRDLRRRNMSDFNVFCLFVLSKGVPGHQVVPAEETSAVFEVAELAEALSMNPSLDGIPKLMFFECRVPSTPSMILVQPSSSMGSDIFIGFSTSGFTPETNKHSSSFVAQLTKSLKENFSKLTFMRIFQQVQYRISSSPVNTGNSQGWTSKTPEMRSTLWKELLFLNPGKDSSWVSRVPRKYGNHKIPREKSSYQFKFSPDE